MRLIWKAPEQIAVLVGDYVFIPHFVASLFRLFFLSIWEDNYTQNN